MYYFILHRGPGSALSYEQMKRPLTVYIRNSVFTEYRRSSKRINAQCFCKWNFHTHIYDTHTQRSWSKNRDQYWWGDNRSKWMSVIILLLMEMEANFFKTKSSDRSYLRFSREPISKGLQLPQFSLPSDVPSWAQDSKHTTAPRA